MVQASALYDLSNGAISWSQSMPQPYDDPATPPRTIYVAGGGKPINAPSLQGDLTTDIAVVGGGFVGISAALHAAEAGARVVVMETHEIGWGAAGRNGGQVPAHATKLEPQEVLRVYGPERGTRLNAAGAGAPGFVEELARRHGIDIQPVHGGIISAAHSPAALNTYRKRAEYWQAQGAPVDYLDGRAAADAIGSDFYLGAIVDRRGIAINPLAFVRGLARAALSRGVDIRERSRVTKLDRHGADWRIGTAAGSVTAHSVLLCTNAYTDDLWPGLKRTIIPVRSYQVWSRPLSDNVSRTVLPHASAMVDSRRLLSGLRRHPDNRLHFSGGGPGFGAERAPDLAGAVRRMRELFPQLDTIEVEHWWSGWVTRGIDDGWRLHELAPGLLTAIACNGRGVAMGPMMGRELARYLGGTPERDLLVPLTKPNPIRGYAVHKPVGTALIRYYGWLDQHEIGQMRARRVAQA
jgi:glycine/D-amino acid oxidase-like deaminating enzyme